MITLSTPRLHLREFTPDDIPAFHALESHPSVARFQTWLPRSLPEATAAVHTIIANRAAAPRVHVELAVCLPALPTPFVGYRTRFIGRVGCHVSSSAASGGGEGGERGGDPRGEEKAADLWFSFMPEMQGNGFAAEAVQALATWLEQEMGIGLLRIECDPRNRGSWRLAQRLGFRKVEEVERAMECKGEWVGSMVWEKDVRRRTGKSQ